jgi:hypothetical protein
MMNCTVLHCNCPLMNGGLGEQTQEKHPYQWLAHTRGATQGAGHLSVFLSPHSLYPSYSSHLAIFLSLHIYMFNYLIPRSIFRCFSSTLYIPLFLFSCLYLSTFLLSLYLSFFLNHLSVLLFVSLHALSA